MKIGEANDRATKGTSDVVWSLKDINFEVEQGTAMGIIGKNGAGKSTLLKILSRVTGPTMGSIKVKGRIASLLEVGTGFHPELTGKENIFLNGAILGMRKKEILRKFDEIVDFSGVERYINTPVKRYSSGMYVRLAFAVAAHLESEILIVDEVLAVGDADFQKKCMGKMGDISKGEGRTILFVSHNMSSVAKLCSEAILLKDGKINFAGPVDKTIDKYLNENDFRIVNENSSKSSFTLKDVVLIDRDLNQVYSFDVNQDIGIKMVISKNDIRHKTFYCGVNLYGDYAKAILTTVEVVDMSDKNDTTLICWLPSHLFTGDQQFKIRLNGSSIEDNQTVFHYDFPELMIMNLIEKDTKQRKLMLESKFSSMLTPKFEWEID